ncbi:hypothetical protein, partial [Sphingobium scionense]
PGSSSHPNPTRRSTVATLSGKPSYTTPWDTTDSGHSQRQNGASASRPNFSLSHVDIAILIAAVRSSLESEAIEALDKSADWRLLSVETWKADPEDWWP